MKKIIFTVIFLGLTFASFAQDTAADEIFLNQKNEIGVSYVFLYGNGRYDGIFSGNGFEISYSRYLWENKLYANISWGKNYVSEKKELSLWIEDKYITMNILSFGLGYNFLIYKNLSLAGELHYISLKYNAIDYSLTDENGNVEVMQYGQFNDQSLRIQLKARYVFLEDFAVIPVLGYGFMRSSYETIWFKIGVGYLF